MTKRSLLLFCAIAALAVTGCAKPDPLLGTWTGDAEQNGVKTKVQQTFEAGGKYTMNTEADVMNNKIKVTVNGTYVKKENDLTVTMVDYKLDGVPKQFEPMIKSSLDTEKGKADTVQVKWNGNDEIEMTIKGKTQTFKRVK